MKSLAERHLPIFLKGMAMGAADVVPGVSGGTIAFITGIYDTLLESIRRINPSLFSIVKTQGVSGAFDHINGKFLIVLFTGILTSIVSLAKLISFLLTNHPIPIWSFFFGLIVVSVYHVGREVDKKTLSRILMLLIGVAFAYTITMLKPMTLEPSVVNIIIAGAIAICAMILPGISGSFILLLLGMYTTVLAAIKGFQLDVIFLFGIGCLVGLLTFSHLLSFLLKRARDLTLSFLIGLMMGTLPKIWPWKETLTWRTNSSGEQVPLTERNLLPHQFEQITGQEAQLLLGIVLMSFAVVLVLLLERFAEKNAD
ncbi:MAG: DUF368 domain-containing protein [Pseudomonadota bacterium]